MQYAFESPFIVRVRPRRSGAACAIVEKGSPP